ncbi:L-serine ammonia-lyase [Rhizorhabdus dicambivorans]|uniref:L-serine dehydratase n=1 Tax=Rhizorhabdus dicambivorans TaxID=1850238 RepID=A0A2A4FXQ2_9SPHN|nr:L-serine ammonia-lyase [Rhizorhabdus dicambivorans]ATE64217.1 L-serine ammonia-lyase [Rhizorhabdus dicambivorans]PCE42510.1 L-serine ammonia-lyase [Rhizorhabdus dicambivorans]
MIVSTFELFKLGVGPSSSHTMGPMIAAGRFVAELERTGRLHSTAGLKVTLYASLALTGKGHATDRAVLLGLSGFWPDTIDLDAADAALQAIQTGRRLTLGGGSPIAFDAQEDIVWAHRERLPGHPNALRLTAIDASNEAILAKTYYSIGGGFVIAEDEAELRTLGDNRGEVPLPFASATELLRQADAAGLTIAGVMRENELALRTGEELESGLDDIIAAMDACMDRGLGQHGELPGGLKVKRRAKEMLAALEAREAAGDPDPLAPMDWVNLWAMAVNEENAAGGRVVTAPTNGAAGILPAVLRYFDRYHGSTPDSRRVFILTAAAIGALYKRNASISGAEVGCQGEVGVACSMAAGALAAVLGGTNAQVENAAEIAMEHNLGLTCDPIGGLVQIPCIERNAMGAIKAIDAARLALMGNGEHHVSLDKVIETMKRTGADMSDVYKETSLGGLAVSFADC